MFLADLSFKTVKNQLERLLFHSKFLSRLVSLVLMRDLRRVGKTLKFEALAPLGSNIKRLYVDCVLAVIELKLYRDIKE